MSRRKSGKQDLPVIENLEIIDAGSEGKAIGRVENKVVFVPYGVPGDVVDVQIIRKKKSFYEGRILRIHHYSPIRTEARCEHFGLCGGCRWQNMDYAHQLVYKQKQVQDNFDRIGKFAYPEINEILASQDVYYYRNKLEYTFSNRKWFTGSRPAETDNIETRGLGFHLPGMFDRIIDINQCHLQPEPSNAIRLAVRDYALKEGLSFYNVKIWEGLMRNLIIRTTLTGQVMAIVVFHEERQEVIDGLMNHIMDHFPLLTSLQYVINPKRNDDISDLEVRLYHGNPYLLEVMPAFGLNDADLQFKIGPVSFFQVNVRQASRLYYSALSMADLQGHEIVYDLYSGTGTIACYASKYCSKVVGLEYNEAAVADANENAKLNGLDNCSFHAGDIAKILDADFFARNGRPEVIITDPPRSGMHEKVVQQILNAAPEKVIYISCNPATQARDIQLMSEQYDVMSVQPVDMFPHTQHVENIALLVRKLETGNWILEA